MLKDELHTLLTGTATGNTFLLDRCNGGVCFSVHPSIEFIDRRFVDDAHARNLKVYVYTVNHPEDMARMHELGADGVFTNFPERVVARYSQRDRTIQWD